MMDAVLTSKFYRWHPFQHSVVYQEASKRHHQFPAIHAQHSVDFTAAELVIHLGACGTCISLYVKSSQVYAYILRGINCNTRQLHLQPHRNINYYTPPWLNILLLLANSQGRTVVDKRSPQWREICSFVGKKHSQQLCSSMLQSLQIVMIHG